MFERFTSQARRVVVLAQEEARELRHNYIGTEHILLGLLREGEGAAAKALEAAEVTLEGARREVETIIGRGKHEPSGHIPFTPRAKKVLELSLREAVQLGHNSIGTGHILLGLIREGDGVAVQMMRNLGADPNKIRQRVILELREDSDDDPAVAVAPAVARVRLGTRPRREVHEYLDMIESRLAAIELHLGMRGATGEDAGAETDAGAQTGEGLRLGEEIGRLRAEVARLSALLHEHGIDSGGAAAAG
jgi:ATP-dependent Clp protease ATP-binding subunit ClpA